MGNIWVKTSLLALTYDQLNDGLHRAQLAETISVVALGWYAALPVVAHVLNTMLTIGIEVRTDGCSLDSAVISMICALPFFSFLILALHFVGVFTCASHDLAITGLGCTLVQHNTTISNSS